MCFCIIDVSLFVFVSFLFPLLFMYMLNPITQTSLDTVLHVTYYKQQSPFIIGLLCWLMMGMGIVRGLRVLGNGIMVCIKRRLLPHVMHGGPDNRKER